MSGKQIEIMFEKKMKNNYLFSVFEDNGFHIERFYVGKEVCRLVVKFRASELKKIYGNLQLNDDNFKQLFGEYVKIYGFELKNCHTAPQWYGNYGVNNNICVDEDIYISDLYIDLKDAEVCFSRECFGNNVKSDLSYKPNPADISAIVKNKVDEVKEMMKDKYKGFVEPLESTELAKVVKDRFDLLDMR